MKTKSSSKLYSHPAQNKMNGCPCSARTKNPANSIPHPVASTMLRNAMSIVNTQAKKFTLKPKAQLCLQIEQNHGDYPEKPTAAPPPSAQPQQPQISPGRLNNPRKATSILKPTFTVPAQDPQPKPEEGSASLTDSFVWISPKRKSLPEPLTLELKPKATPRCNRTQLARAPVSDLNRKSDPYKRPTRSARSMPLRAALRRQRPTCHTPRKQLRLATAAPAAARHRRPQQARVET